MLAKLSLIALFAAPLASALTLHPLTNPRSQGTVTITWDIQEGDPEFITLELNHPSFNDRLAIATTINTDLGEHTVTIPVVPAQDGYILEAVNIGDINDVYAQVGPFTIGAAASASVPSSSTRTFPTGSSSAVSGSASITRSGSSGTSSNTASNSDSGSNSGSNSGSQTSSGNTPNVSNLIDTGAALPASVASAFGVFGAAVAGAILVL